MFEPSSSSGPSREPLRLERQLSVGIAEADEAPVRVERRGDLLHRPGQHCVEVGVRPDLLGEGARRRPRDAPGARVRGNSRIGPRLGRERLQPPRGLRSRRRACGPPSPPRALRRPAVPRASARRRRSRRRCARRARADPLRGARRRRRTPRHRGTRWRRPTARVEVEAEPRADQSTSSPAVDHRDAMGSATVVDERDRGHLDVCERTRAVGDRACRLVDRVGGSQPPELPRPRGRGPAPSASACARGSGRRTRPPGRRAIRIATNPGQPLPPMAAGRSDQEAEDDRGEAATGEDEGECELEARGPRAAGRGRTGRSEARGGRPPPSTSRGIALR